MLLSARLFAQTDIRQGLVAYWPLDTTDGTTTPELVAGLHMNVFNMDASNIVEGRRGSALSFDGSTEYAVRISDPAENTGLPIYSNPAYTITLWVKASLPRATDRRIFSEANTGTGIASPNNPLLNLGTHNTDANNPAVDVFIRNDAGTTLHNHVKSATPGVVTDEWHHIAFVDNNGQARLYIDGVADSAPLNYTRSTTTMNTTSLGAIVRAAVGSYFAGVIDDVALWERPLTAAEVQTVFENGIQTPIPPQAPLVIRQPASSTNSLGTRVILSSQAIGLRPSVTYQWFKGATAIPDATEATLTLNNLLPADAGSYTLRITTPNGTTTTDAAVITVQDDPAPDVRNGLLSFWPLDTLDSASSTTPDLYSRNDFQLVNMDSANFLPSPRTNALGFDGIEEHARRASGSALYGNNTNYSVAFWVKGPAGQPDRRVFSEASTANNNPLFNLGTANDAVSPGLDVYIRNDDGSNPVNHRKSTTPVFDDTWHHVAWVDQNGTARLYIDGVLDLTDFNYTRGTMTPNTTSLGAIVRTAASTWFTGEVDDVAIWNRALTYSEIQRIYTNNVPAPVAAIPASITLHPVGATLYQGDRIVLTADATGTAPLTLQWLKDGAVLAGETNRSLLLSNMQTDDTGVYTFRASNVGGPVTSDPATVTVNPVTSLRTALVAHWPFETVGATTPDVINGNDLTAVNFDPASHVDGKVGKGVSFQGTNYFVRYHATNASIGLPISSNRAFTVSFWVNALEPDNVQDRRFFSEASTTSNNPLFNIGTPTTASVSAPWVNVYIRNSNNSNPVNHRQSTIAAYDETWHHVTYVDNNGMVSLYVDGVLEPVTDFNYTRGVLIANTTSLGAIVRAAVGSQVTTGIMDEVALWARALSEVEVLNLFANGPTGGGGGGQLEIANITAEDNIVRISVATSADPSTLKVQSIDNVTDSNWTDVAGVTWTQADGQAIAQFAAPASNKFYRISGPAGDGGDAQATVTYSEDFEGAATGWTHGGVADSWTLGQPVIGPGLAYSGEAVYGTGLNGPYANDSIQWLRSPVIDLTGVTSGRISYQEFRDMEAAVDTAQVLIKDATNPDALLATLAVNDGTRASWSKRSFVIPAEALGKRVIVEFLMTTDSANGIPRPGWFIDDFTVIRN